MYNLLGMHKPLAQLFITINFFMEYMYIPQTRLTGQQLYYQYRKHTVEPELYSL